MYYYLNIDFQKFKTLSNLFLFLVEIFITIENLYKSTIYGFKKGKLGRIVELRDFAIFLLSMLVNGLFLKLVSSFSLPFFEAAGGQFIYRSFAVLIQFMSNLESDFKPFKNIDFAFQHDVVLCYFRVLLPYLRMSDKSTQDSKL